MTGYRTLLFNVLVAVVGVLSATDWVQLVGSTRAGWVVTGIGIVGTVLRFLTTTPVGEAPKS